MGFLSEHDGIGIDKPVSIFIRVPGLDAMVGSRVEAGSREFRHRYSEAPASGPTATDVLNADNERILIEHRLGAGWELSVEFSGRAALVTTFWAQSDQEWDYLVKVGTRLRNAIR